MKLTHLLVSILLTVGAVAAQNCAFTTFTRPCGSDLAGAVVRGPAVQWNVTNAAPASYAVLAIGQQARPMPLPGTDCLLVVNPRVMLVQPVDSRGNSTFLLRLPPITGLSLDFQAVTVAVNRRGRFAESTNAITMACR